jgi:peroxiredoxin
MLGCTTPVLQDGWRGSAIFCDTPFALQAWVPPFALQAWVLSFLFSSRAFSLLSGISVRSVHGMTARTVLDWALHKQLYILCNGTTLFMSFPCRAN